MINFKVIISFIFIFALSSFAKINSIANDKRYELSIYGNLNSIENNVYLQTDLCAGVNLFDHFNLSSDLDFSYRNYFTSIDYYLSISAGTIFLRSNEIRAGFTGGFCSEYFSGYKKHTPCFGGEILYSLNIKDNLSFRLKERIMSLYEAQHSTIATSTFLGFSFLFGTKKR